jgi:hypothetical protein
MTSTSLTLAELLEHKQQSSLRRAANLTEARYSISGHNVIQAVEVEQALDDAERYARLSDRLRTLEAGVGDGPYGPDVRYSVVADALNARMDSSAQNRLATLKRDRHRADTATRSTTSANVVGFVVPQYLSDAAAPQVAAGRALVDLIGPRRLPDDGLTLSTGRVTTGSTSEQQSAEHATVTTTNIVFEGVTIPVRTIRTRAVISRQAFDRVEGGWQDGLLVDMVEAHAQTVGMTR